MKPLIVPFFISHRGCPHKCVFCDQIKIAGSGGEFPTAAEMLCKIAAYRQSGGRSSVEVAFYGGTFTALPFAAQEKLLLPLGPLVAAGEVEAIRVSTRPDAVDDQTARYLKGMGVKTVELGVQSMANDVLALSGRGHTAADVDRACSILQAAGIAVGVQLMPGLPGDTPEKSLDSFMRVIALQPDFLRVYPTLVIVGTQLATLYENGSYQPLNLDAAVRLCKVLLHRAWQAGIPIIRMGLQPTAELEKIGTILSGPFHPAFRYLVEAELCYDLLLRMTRGIARGSHLKVSCAPRMVSSLAGHRRGNVERLARAYGLTLTGVRGDPALSPLEMTVERDGEVWHGDLIADLDYA